MRMWWVFVFAFGVGVGVSAASYHDGDRALVRAVVIDGLDGQGPTEEALLALQVELGRFGREYVAPRTDLPRHRVPLWALGRGPEGAAMRPSGLQAVADRIARAYADHGLFGTRVDIREGDLARLRSPDSEGLLVVRVRLAENASEARLSRLRAPERERSSRRRRGLK